MKLNSTDLMIVIILFLLGAFVTYIYLKSPKTVSPPTHNRILYLRDSFEMEYYKSLVDTTYFFDHSKIPDNESNP